MLPTSGTARFSSPLGVYDFQKRSSLIEVSEAGAQVLGPIAAELAYGEGLQAHARAAEFRLKGTGVPMTASRESCPAPAVIRRTMPKSMHGYASSPAPASSSSTRWRTLPLPPELQRPSWAAPGPRGDQPLSRRRIDTLTAALAAYAGCPPAAR